MSALLEEASFSRELNSLDNSSAVARDALRSSLMVWTGDEPQTHRRRLPQGISSKQHQRDERQICFMKLTQHAAAKARLGTHGCEVAALGS